MSQMDHKRRFGEIRSPDRFTPTPQSLRQGRKPTLNSRKYARLRYGSPVRQPYFALEGEAPQLTSTHRAEPCSVKLGLAAAVGFEQRKEHVVPPRAAHTQIVAQQAFITEPEFFD